MRDALSGYEDVQRQDKDLMPLEMQVCRDTLSYISELKICKPRFAYRDLPDPKPEPEKAITESTYSRV